MLHSSATNQEQLLGCQIVKHPFGWRKSSCVAERLDPFINNLIFTNVVILVNLKTITTALKSGDVSLLQAGELDSSSQWIQVNWVFTTEDILTCQQQMKWMMVEVLSMPLQHTPNFLFLNNSFLVFPLQLWCLLLTPAGPAWLLKQKGGGSGTAFPRLRPWQTQEPLDTDPHGLQIVCRQWPHPCRHLLNSLHVFISTHREFEQKREESLGVERCTTCSLD